MNLFGKGVGMSGKLFRSRSETEGMSRTSSQISKIKMNTSPILKLNVNSLNKLFDWLTLKELHALAQTCQRFKVICGAYYLLNYTPSAVCIDDGIVAHRHQSRGVTYGYQLNIFCQYIEKMIIPSGSQNQFRYAEMNCGKALTAIRFDGVVMTESKIKCIKRLLANVEAVEIVDCKMFIYIYEGFLKYCHKLKRLKIRNIQFNTFLNKDKDWLLRKFPTLEHLDFTKCSSIKRSELEVLFKQNPNIRTFELDMDQFWENKMVFLEACIMWNDLIIHFQDAKNPMTSTIYSLLNTFFNRGHFKRLHLRYSEVLKQPFIDQIASLYAVDTIHMKEEAGSWLPSLINLRELYTFCGKLNMEKTVSNLANLEKVVFWEANVEDVLAIVRNSMRIREIKIRTLNEKGRFSPNFNGKNFFNQNQLNLTALNEERKKILGARKVSIFVNEDIFIATKWTTGETVHSLIELKRVMMHEWNDLFQT
ncbi:uncharacterized protein LOC129573403 [Sitodiplosis mosellana]|uniref:uncharacterized protein LOC129573403 n=1 Tax=Sitodiplosis mosellana TaxID=263140 RepID=UPI0024452451|nr:uncharacterized protein LOC129573403 [Sitodiplosis mosellana]